MCTVAEILIDTWWNVNKRRYNVSNAGIFVLIDTWWNVNVGASVEKNIEETVLIDTWWNVNIIMLVVPFSASGF